MLDLIQFPINQRRHLTFKKVRDIVDVIDKLESSALVHCLNGSTRTSMVSAGYQIMHGSSKPRVIWENFGMRYWNWNTNSLREMLRYSA